MAITIYGGHASTWSSDANLGANVLRINRLSLREDATIEAVVLRLHNTGYASAKVTGYIYDEDPATGLPRNLIATTNERIGLTAASYNDLTFAVNPVLAAGNYYVGYVSDVTLRMCVMIFRNFQEYNQTHTYGTAAPDPWPTGTATWGGSTAVGVKYTRANENEYEAFYMGHKDLAGPTTHAWNSGQKRAFKYSIPYDAEADKISLYLPETPAAATKVKAMIYADNGSGAPGALLATSAERQRVDSYVWTDFFLPSTLVMPAGDYWIGLIADAQIQYSSWATGTRAYNNNTYATGPTNPFGAATVDVQEASVYIPLTITSALPLSGEPYPMHPGWSSDLSNGSTLGWVVGTGQWFSMTGMAGTTAAPPPNGNVAYLGGNNATNNTAYHDYVIPAWQLGDIDTEIVSIEFSAWLHSRSVNDPAGARIICYDASDNIIVTGTTGDITNNLAWVKHTATVNPVPQYTRKIRFEVYGSKNGTLSDIYNGIGNVEGRLMSAFTDAFSTSLHANVAAGETTNRARLTAAHVNILIAPNRKKSSFLLMI